MNPTPSANTPHAYSNITLPHTATAPLAQSDRPPRPTAAPLALLAFMTVMGGQARPAGAQIVNVLARLTERTTDGWGGSLTGTLTAKRGNTNLTRGAGRLATTYKHGPHSLHALGSADYGESWSATSGGSDNATPFINKTFEHIRYRYELTSHWQMENFVQHEFDEFRRLKLRALAGIGMRARLQPTTDLELAIGTACMAEYELLTAGAGQEDPGDVKVRYRSSSYLQVVYALDSDLIFSTTTFVQPRIAALHDVRILSETALKIKAKDWLSVSLGYNFSYDSRPAPNVEERDHSLVTAVTVSW